MLPASKRLKKEDFPQVTRGGSLFFSPSFTLRIGQFWASGVRIAVVVSKKVDKGSVGRHRIKRRVHSALERFVGRLRPGLGAVITCNRDLKGVTLNEIVSELEVVFRKSGALN